MSSVTSRRIPNVVLGLSLFWAGIISAFFWTDGFNFKFLAPWALSLITGVWLAQNSSNAYKKLILANLRYRSETKLLVSDRSAFLNSERGIFSTLGSIPFQYPLLPRAETYVFADLERHCPPELTANNVLANILGKYLSPTGRSQYAPYVAIFDAVARIYLHPSHINLPAGIDRHGERSLLSHNLLVCALMLHRAPDYVYNTGSLSAIDPNFKLDPLDPLLPIIGLSHDLGKIRTFIFNANGKVCGLQPGHDSHSARNMAMLEEFWDASIQSEERRVLQSALAYYHHMSGVPVQKNERIKSPTVTSDRLHALLGLLNECDRLASNIEMGSPYSFNTAPPVIAIEPITKEEIAENLFSDFSRYIATFAPINSRGGTKSVAFKYKDDELTDGKDILIFDEMEFVSSFSSFIKKPELNVREGKSSALTATVLSMLDENGYLFRPKEGIGHRSATSCLFSFEFTDPDKEDSDEKRKFHLSSGFMVDITNWPKMDQKRALPNIHAKPSITKARFGSQGVSRRTSAADNIASSELTGAPPATTGALDKFIEKHNAKHELNPEKIIQKIGNALISKRITIALETETGYAIIHADKFFKNLKVQVEEHADISSELSAFGILSIKKSIQFPDEHVIILDKGIYLKFKAT